MAKKIQPTPKTFEDALAELERILSDMEAGTIGLEESLGKYERGAFLVQHCRGVLNAAEKQIETLSRGSDGGLQSTPLPAPSLGTAESLPGADVLPDDPLDSATADLR